MNEYMSPCTRDDALKLMRRSPEGSTVIWRGKRLKVLRRYPYLCQTPAGAIPWKDLAVEAWYKEGGKPLPKWYPTRISWDKQPGAHH